MENQETLNMMQGFRTWIQRNPEGFTSESRILEIQRAERAALSRHAEHSTRLCYAEKARNDAVLERLGLSVQVAPLPSPRPPVFSRESVKFSRGRRIGPLLDVPRLNVVDINKYQRSPKNMGEEADSFWDKVRLGSQIAADACKAVGDHSPIASISSVYSLSPSDRDTPSELRAIRLIEDTFRPTPPPLRAAPRSRTRVSRLPVFSAKLRGVDKKDADGYSLQTAKHKVEVIMETYENLKLKFLASPRPPVAPKRTPPVNPKRTPAATLARTPTVVPARTHGVAPLASTPPTVPQMKKSGTLPFLRPANAVRGAGKKAATDRSLQTKRVELQPLTNPVQSLSVCFELLSSDDWMKKIESMKIIQALAQHHSEILKTKLHEVCVGLIEEVNNLRSAVACGAMNTLAELYVDLQKAMDPEVEGTGRALLLKPAQTTNVFIHQQANLALDAMVGNCSYGRVMSALLKTGLRHGCAAVRGSAAQHLHRLVDGLGAASILAARRSFTERFLIAVSKMCEDAASTVRHHGQIILQELALQKDFLGLWTKIIPETERRSLGKVLKTKMK